MLVIFRRFVCLFVLLLFAATGLAEEVATLPYASSVEKDAYDNGLEILSTWEGEWHGLPLLDDETNKLLHSLLANGSIEKRTLNTCGNAYTRWDLLLQKKSVLDLTMQVMDGVYYEQSNLLGGETVAFTSDEFAVFMNRIALLSQDVMPQNLDIVYDLVFHAIAGEKDTQAHVALATMEEVVRGWQATAFKAEEQTRPKVMLPGYYGTYAMVSKASRDELLALAEAVGSSLFDGERTVKSVSTAQTQDDKALAAQASILSVTDGLYSLADTLAMLLPEDMQPLMYREVYDHDNNLVSRQVEVMATPIKLYIEWSSMSQSSQAIYVTITTSNEKITMLYTNENGSVIEERKIRRVKNRSVTEVSFLQGDVEAHVLRTSVQEIENNGGKEVVNTQTKWMVDSEKLLGKDELVTLAKQQTETITGQGAKYKHIKETEWILSGLQFTGKPFLTTRQLTTIKESKPIVIAEAQVVHPAALDAEAFEAWIEGLRFDAMQVGLTILGRIPSSNAAYLLKLLQSQ